MTKRKTRRVYRLRRLARHVPWCEAWIIWLDSRRLTMTAEAVLAEANRFPWRKRGALSGGLAWDVRFAAHSLAERLATAALDPEERWWAGRKWTSNGNLRTSRITPEERDRFVRLWIRYADKHGLYETVPA